MLERLAEDLRAADHEARRDVAGGEGLVERAGEHDAVEERQALARDHHVLPAGQGLHLRGGTDSQVSRPAITEFFRPSGASVVIRRRKRRSSRSRGHGRSLFLPMPTCGVGGDHAVEDRVHRAVASSPPVFARMNELDVERVVLWRDAGSGLEAILVIDDVTLGPAAAGVRTRAYPSHLDALTEVAGLARAMTIKCALAGLAAGGGKCVVLDHAGLDRRAPSRSSANGSPSSAGCSAPPATSAPPPPTSPRWRPAARTSTPTRPTSPPRSRAASCAASRRAPRSAACRSPA